MLVNTPSHQSSSVYLHNVPPPAISADTSLSRIMPTHASCFWQLRDRAWRSELLLLRVLLMRDPVTAWGSTDAQTYLKARDVC